MNAAEQEQTLSKWLDRHTGLLIKVVRSFARSNHDQDDLFQDISLRLWESIPRYQPDIAETTWIYRVAFYTAINWSKRERRREKQKSKLAEQSNHRWIKPPSPDPRIEWLYDKISELPPIDRSVTLMMLDGVSYREMSETLGISEGNVGVRIHRIKKKLIQWNLQENERAN